MELQNRERKFRDAPNEKTYKNLRAAFSTAIGTKVCVDFVKAQDASMTEEDRRKEEAEIKEREAAWDKRWEARKKICEIANADPDFLEDLEYYGLTEYELSIYDEMLEEEPLYVPDGYIKECNVRRGEYVIPITSVKFRMVRKQLKLNQRVFAKKIGYPNVNKYALLEQGRLAELGMTIYNAYPDELIKAVVDATYANPYWLMDHREESLYDVETESTAITFEEADNWWMYPMFVDAKVIRYWWTHRK